MKKILIFILCLMIFLMPVGSVFAAPASGYVVDMDESLTANELSQLNALAAQISDEVGAEVGLLILDKAGEIGTVGYAEKYYYDNGFGLNGLLLIDNIGDNEWYIHTSGNLNEITEADEDALWDAYIGQGNFYSAAESYLNAAKDLVVRKGLGTVGGPVFVPEERVLTRVEDRANLLSSGERSELEAILDEVSERQQVDVVVATVNSLEGKSPQAYADDYFDYNGFGMGPNYDGVVLLLGMDTRDAIISTHGFGITAITDYGVEYIFDEITPALSDGNYFGAFKEFAEISDSFITQAKAGNAIDTDNEPKNELNGGVLGAMGAIGAGVGSTASAAYLGTQKRAHKSLARRQYAGEYSSGVAHIFNQNERFLRSNVTRTPIPKAKPPSSGGGGGSSTHRSSSGRSHGGGSRKF